MNRSSLQSLMYDYCLDRLNLRETDIKFFYDKKLKVLGEARGNWDNKGRLRGNLEIKIKQVRDLKVTLDTIAHELIHISQYVNGTVAFKKGNRLYAGVPDHYKYSERQTEREANKRAMVMTNNFLDRHWDDMSLWSKLNIMYFNIVG